MLVSDDLFCEKEMIVTNATWICQFLIGMTSNTLVLNKSIWHKVVIGGTKENAELRSKFCRNTKQVKIYIYIYKNK